MNLHPAGDGLPTTATMNFPGGGQATRGTFGGYKWKTRTTIHEWSYHDSLLYRLPLVAPVK